MRGKSGHMSKKAKLTNEEKKEVKEHQKQTDFGRDKLRS